MRHTVKVAVIITALNTLVSVGCSPPQPLAPTMSADMQPVGYLPMASTVTLGTVHVRNARDFTIMSALLTFVAGNAERGSSSVATKQIRLLQKNIVFGSTTHGGPNENATTTVSWKQPTDAAGNPLKMASDDETVSVIADTGTYQEILAAYGPNSRTVEIGAVSLSLDVVSPTGDYETLEALFPNPAAKLTKVVPTVTPLFDRSEVSFTTIGTGIAPSQYQVSFNGDMTGGSGALCKLTFDWWFSGVKDNGMSALTWKVAAKDFQGGATILETGVSSVQKTSIPNTYRGTITTTGKTCLQFGAKNDLPLPFTIAPILNTAAVFTTSGEGEPQLGTTLTGFTWAEGASTPLNAPEREAPATMVPMSGNTIGGN